MPNKATASSNALPCEKEGSGAVLKLIGHYSGGEIARRTRDPIDIAVFMNRLAVLVGG